MESCTSPQLDKLDILTPFVVTKVFVNVLSGEATYIVFGLTRSKYVLLIYGTHDEQANQDTTEV
jgi:hypothetical protein